MANGTAIQFVDNKNGTVTDTKTGLMWQKAEVGTKNWEAGLAYCKTLRLAGYKDWRLPERNELESIVDKRYYDPCIDRTIFPGAMSSYYLSSTFNAIYPGSAWSVNFYNGDVHYSDKSGNCYVRAVRGGQ